MLSNSSRARADIRMKENEHSTSSTSTYLIVVSVVERVYRDRLKGVHILLSKSQAGPGRKVKQELQEISRNHVQAF